MSGGPLEFLALAALRREQAAAIGATLTGMDPWRTLGYQAETLARGLESTHPDLIRYLAARGCFYEKQGFHPVGVIADLVVAGQDEVLMRKVIRPAAGSP